MKANNLTISIPTPVCEKSCPFCISKMTHSVDVNPILYYNNLQKVIKFANNTGVNNILFTGKGEPLENLEDLYKIMQEFNDFPLELQTNGERLNAEPEIIEELLMNNLNVIAISVWHPSRFFKIFKRLFEILVKAGLVVRVTIVLNDAWKDITFEDIINHCKEIGIHQLTFRIPTVPKVLKIDPIAKYTADWITLHGNGYEKILQELNSACLHNSLIRKLPFGAEIYDIEGIAVTKMDYCIQESSNDDDIRSLIYQTDGHLYTTWDKKSSILF